MQVPSHYLRDHAGDHGGIASKEVGVTHDHSVAEGERHGEVQQVARSLELNER